ncbi:Phosphotyrosyl phosphatase activator [Scheffersomyces amazonensis]|uniref:Phosphotyrosyl phosphatase activator n=1 Tax=Scheffersomyces amazonensis TaxID=1078765 RepID=UPI00315C7C6E
MNFTKPVRRILTAEDLDKWIDSPTYTAILEFVVNLQQSVTGLTNDNADIYVSDSVNKILNILDEINATIDRNPVVVDKNISRFGKIEFRDFYDEVSQTSSQLLIPLLGEAQAAEIEVSTYFNECWGNRTRIDYGSGHELNLICFLLCLRTLNIVTDADYSALVLRVFTKYITIMRRLQKIYWLEPAGSHGVWGLDDYHFLPFLFGSSQLSTHPHMKPKSIHNEDVVDLYYKKYMYFECIHFINNIKTLPKNQEQKLSIRWHSPMLDDISAAKSWTKIKEGMIKMYKAEVLGKLPIIQHVMFGSLIPCPEGVTEAHTDEDDNSDCGHIHNVINPWGDCCGIKIPSAIAASESLRINENQQKVHYKPVPFD